MGNDCLFAIAWRATERPFAVIETNRDDIDEFMMDLKCGRGVDISSGEDVLVDISSGEYLTIYRGEKVAYMGNVYREVKFSEK